MQRQILDRVVVKNFQSHKNTVLSLHPGINAITGPSDSGKSAIFRAINWVVKNRPTGNAFQSYFAGKKDATSVSLVFGDERVIRIKKGTLNSYKLGTDEFKAIRTDVPNEISNFIKLDDVNVQGQHEKYFQLQDSSGEVAKTLNRIANLDIIDFCIAEVQSDVRSSKREAKFLENKISEMEDKLSKYDHLDDVEVLVENLENFEKEQKECLQKYDRFVDVLEFIEETEGKIKEIDSWLLVEKDSEQLFLDLQELEDNKKQKKLLVSILDSISKTEQDIDNIDYIISAERSMELLIAVGDERKKIQQKLNDLKIILLDIDNTVEDLDEADERVQMLTDQITEYMEQLEVCPLCGGELKTHDSRWIE